LAHFQPLFLRMTVEGHGGTQGDSSASFAARLCQPTGAVGPPGAPATT
jgi:hypothetical protein